MKTERGKREGNTPGRGWRRIPVAILLAAVLACAADHPGQARAGGEPGDGGGGTSGAQLDAARKEIEARYLDRRIPESVRGMLIDTSTPDWRRRFPYKYDRKEHFYWYERIRYEEKFFNTDDPWAVIRYITKYIRKMKHFTPQLENYFMERNRHVTEELDSSLHYTLDTAFEPFTMEAVGDVMWIRKGWRDFLRPPLPRDLAAADLTFGNLETPVSPSHKVKEYAVELLKYNSPVSLLDTLATGGVFSYTLNTSTITGLPLEPRKWLQLPIFDVLSIINNHSLDMGIDGARETCAEVEKRMLSTGATPISSVPAEKRFVIYRRKGYAIAVIAYTWGINSFAGGAGPLPPWLNVMPLCKINMTPDFDLFEKQVANARAAGADFIVLSLHWGFEFEYWPHPHFMILAREFAARGADLIIGHHPHVLQSLETLHVNMPEYSETTHYVEDPTDPAPRVCLVVYSLGNFASAMFTYPCLLGGILEVELHKAMEKKTGRRRTIITGAALNPTFVQKQAKGWLKLDVAVRDVPWALSTRSRRFHVLRRRIRKALEQAELRHRIGDGWLDMKIGPAVHRPRPWRWLELRSPFASLR